MTVVTSHPHVTDIDFAQWRRDGITTLLFDIEGTLTEWADPAVDPRIIDHLKAARSAGIESIGLVTNISARYESRVKQVAEQVGADSYRLPRRFVERKPSSAMIVDTLDEFDEVPGNCGFIGDKIVDIAAGKNADVARVAWVERYGTADHWFDRYIYRHLERRLRKQFSAR